MIQQSFNKILVECPPYAGSTRGSWLGISSPGREMNGLPTLQSTLYHVPIKPSQGHQGIRRKSLVTGQGCRGLTWNISWSWQDSTQRSDSPEAFQTWAPVSRQTCEQGYHIIINQNLLVTYCVPGTALRAGDTAVNKLQTILPSW